MKKRLFAVLMAFTILSLALQGCGSDNTGSSQPPVDSKSWGTARLIETDDTGDAHYPKIAFDGSGNAIAVWIHYNGDQRNVMANRYNVDSGWGTAELIETDDTGIAHAPKIAFDGSGNAIAVWEHHDGTHSSIMANRYTAGSGWGTAELIEWDVRDANTPQIAFDSSGNAIAVWSQYDGVQGSIMANFYTADSGWGAVELIETDDIGGGYHPQIAFDGSGNAIAVWEHYDGTKYSIMANCYTAGSGWGTAELIETDNAGHAQDSQIAFDRSGNAIAVWLQSDGTRSNAMANRYTTGSGWGTTELIETDDTGDVYVPQIAFDGSGNAIAVWLLAGDIRHIMANRYTTGSGWGTAESIETYNAGIPYYPQIAFNGSGNAIAVWRQWDLIRYSIMANRFNAESGWGSAELIETDNAGDAQDPQIAFDRSGNAIAVWHQNDGTRDNIMANWFE